MLSKAGRLQTNGLHAFNAVRSYTVVIFLNSVHRYIMQEVTPLILSLWRSAPWWRHYTAPAAPSDRAYFTLLLAHKEKAPVPAMAFRDKEFPNSVMGERKRLLEWSY